jgi:hypothetical protein
MSIVFPEIAMLWRRFMLLCLTLGPVSAAVPVSAHAAAVSVCERRSPSHTVALVELYTSEGCSSCPPADRWLSGLVSRFGSDRLVALSLHVDYWDYIGWRDPFAQPQFSERQRWLTNIAGGRTVYTPEVFVGMRELRAWRDAAPFERHLKEINDKPAGADIRLAMRAVDGRSLNAEVHFAIPPARRAGSELQGVLVLYEDKLVSDVRHGENRGVTLTHDHVVRYWSAPLPLSAEAGAQILRQPLKLAENWNRSKLGLAAFVQNVRTGEVLQAVSLPACLPSA